MARPPAGLLVRLRSVGLICIKAMDWSSVSDCRWFPGAGYGGVIQPIGNLPPMPISAYVLRFHPTQRDRVVEALRASAGVVVGTPTEDGIPIAVDAPTSQAAETLGATFGTIAGVKSATLVYHNFEDVTETAPETMPATTT